MQVPKEGAIRREAGPSRSEQAFDAAFLADPDRAREATDLLRARLQSSNVLFGNAPLPTSLKPHFIRRSDNEEWTALLGKLLRVLERTADNLRLAPDRTGPFSREAWELLDIDPGYSGQAVICRPDVVWDGTRIGLLEMNADSPAMMLYADVVQSLQRDLFPLNQLDCARELTFDERIPRLLHALLLTYGEWGGTEEHPVIAIVDWPDQKTDSEQLALARSFTALGCHSFVCHPHELEIRGGRLFGRGEKIDIIQRRLLFPQIVKRRDELGVFLKAYRERMVCVINPLRSYLVGCKAILAELCRRLNLGLLDAADELVVRSVLPCTLLPSEVDESIEIDRTEWVLKPAFGSGGAGVIIGLFADADAWNDAMRAARVGDWILQRYLPIPMYRVPLAAGHGATPLYANWNPFFFAGKAAGGIARVSSDPVVGISVRGALLPSVIVNDE